MTQVFKDYKGNTGYTFSCETKNAPVGFKHVCLVWDNNKNEEVLTTSITYGNRTWESFMYQSVLDKAADELTKKLTPKGENEYIDTNFLDILCYHEYMSEYGIYGDTDDEYFLILNDEREEEIYLKLVELAKQGRLKPQLNYTMLNVDYGFTDSYVKCEECGKIYNNDYGEIEFIDELGQFFCINCATSNEEVVRIKIENAQEDFRNAVPVMYDDTDMETFGFTKINESSLSCAVSQWGERSPFAVNITIEEAMSLCERYNGFAKLDNVQQFDTLFSIYVPDEEAEEATKELKAIVGE